MKNFILVSLLFICNAAFSQKSDCHVWLGDTHDSVSAIQKTAEQYLQLTLNAAGGEGSKTLYEFSDNTGLGSLKIWMKQKKSFVGSDMVTTYSVSSLKVTGPADRIDALFNVLKAKVADCNPQATDNSVVFGTTKMFIEKQGGDWNKKNVAMSTLTITAK